MMSRSWRTVRVTYYKTIPPTIQREVRRRLPGEFSQLLARFQAKYP